MTYAILYQQIIVILSRLHYSNPFILAGELILSGGWIFIIYSMWTDIKGYWINWRQGIFAGNNSPLLIELKVPKNNQRSIEAIEQIFAQIHGIRRSTTWWESWWKGQFQVSSSFEIVSQEGKIKYYIRVAHKLKNILKNAVFSQYPEAEMRELKPEEDYAKALPIDKFPHPEYDMLGTEYVLVKTDYFPIKTYKDYQNQYLDKHFDPLRNVLEVMSSLKEGEHIWYHLNFIPEFEAWQLAGQTLVNKLIGAEDSGRKKAPSIFAMFKKEIFDLLRRFFRIPAGITREFYSQLAKDTLREIKHQVSDGVYKEIKDQVVCLHTVLKNQLFGPGKPRQTPGPSAAGPAAMQINFNPEINTPKTWYPSRVPFLTPNQLKIVDMIERKMSKQMFRVTLRVAYIAKKPVFTKFRFWAELHGCFKHFADYHSNAFTRGKYSKTTADYAFSNWRKVMRKNKHWPRIKARDWYAGDKSIYLNTEELASLWHFPLADDIGPAVYKTEDKQKQGPYEWPGNKGFVKDRLVKDVRGQVPEDLPIREYVPHAYP